MKRNLPWLLLALLVSLAMACQAVAGGPPNYELAATPSPIPSASPAPAQTPTPLPAAPVSAGEANPNEPVFITGKIPYTSPFFESSLSTAFVMLEDEAGFVKRDMDFQFAPTDQVIGPVILNADKSLTYSLSLPAVPQGVFVNVGNKNTSDRGVQVFAIAYWSNTWDGPFLEPRDGRGWSNAYASTMTDPDRNNEITGGILVVWAPDDKQSFPTSFGTDKKLFTGDDPTAPIPAGYNLVDLNQEPFRFSKEAEPNITLNEGVVGVSDFSKMSYSQAFEAFFQKASKEYPFTQEKKIDWTKLHDTYAPQIAQAKNTEDFYTAMRDFTWQIPDRHVSLSPDSKVFVNDVGGGFGLILAQLGDQRVIVTQVLTNSVAAQAGILPGAEILSWNDQPVAKAIDAVVPYFGPYSTQHDRHLDQVLFLPHVHPNQSVTVQFKNPGGSARSVNMQAQVELNSLFNGIPLIAAQDRKIDLPVEGSVLPSGLGYIRINSFSDDTRLTAELWERFIKEAIDNKLPGLILDVRVNGGGATDLAWNFAGYFFQQEFTLARNLYYNKYTQKFEQSGELTKITPGPQLYNGPVAVLISPSCISACEGFAYAMSQQNRAILVGHYPTAGGFGEVGRGQYKLPGDLTLQIPTGRSETPDGKLIIEGVGVQPTITVPVTMDSAMGKVDAVLNAAVEALLKK